MEGICIFCQIPLSAEETVVVKRGLDTIISKSIQLNDDIHKKIISEELRVHKKCKKNYTRNKTKTAASTSKNDFTARKIRAHNESFDFNKNCIICGEIADVNNENKKPKNLRRRIQLVQTLEFKESLISRCRDSSYKYPSNF